MISLVQRERAGMQEPLRLAAGRQLPTEVVTGKNSSCNYTLQLTWIKIEKLERFKIFEVSLILTALAADCKVFMACVCSYFDGDDPEEDKQKIEIKSEEEEEEVGLGQRKATCKSQR